MEKLKKVLIITVAGESKRFKKSLKQNVLKCIYSIKGRNSILDEQLSLAQGFDQIIIVGGYKFEELKKFVENRYQNLPIALIFNPEYNTYGSGYSFILGMKAIANKNYNEIVFCEGDLYFDKETFLQIEKENADVITSNSKMIRADESVAFYTDLQNNVKYIYDTAHQKIEINEPFTSICNSGQVWKFLQQNQLNEIINQLTQTEIEGTNLVIIEKYFSVVKNFAMIQFKQWVNCNTFADYINI